MTGALAVVLQLISFQTIDGREVLISPGHIVSINETDETRNPTNKLMSGKVHCVINLSNGKFISVTEHCASIRQRLQMQ